MTVVLDGGLATELEARGHDLSDRLWSARLLLTDPAAIEDVHLAYFGRARRSRPPPATRRPCRGSSRPAWTRPRRWRRSRRASTSRGRARDALRRRSDGTWSPAGLLVAGSVGPYGAMLADGSEYRGDYDPGDTPCATSTRRGWRRCSRPAPTCSRSRRSRPCARPRSSWAWSTSSGATAWLSFQCRDGAPTAAGEPIGEAIAVGQGAAGLVAVGVNCTAPRHLPALLAPAAAATDLPLIAYPNSGDRWDPVDRIVGSPTPAGGFDPSPWRPWPMPAPVGSAAAAARGLTTRRPRAGARGMTPERAG